LTLGLDSAGVTPNRTRIRNKREMPAGEFYGLTLDASFEYDYEYEDGTAAAPGLGPYADRPAPEDDAAVVKPEVFEIPGFDYRQGLI